MSDPDMKASVSEVARQACAAYASAREPFLRLWTPRLQAFEAAEPALNDALSAAVHAEVLDPVEADRRKAVQMGLRLRLIEAYMRESDASHKRALAAMYAVYDAAAAP